MDSCLSIIQLVPLDIKLASWTLVHFEAHCLNYSHAISTSILPTCSGPFNQGTLCWVKDYVPAPRPQSLVVHRQKAAAGVVRAVTGKDPPWHDSQVKAGKRRKCLWSFLFHLVFWKCSYDVLRFLEKTQPYKTWLLRACGNLSFVYCTYIYVCIYCILYIAHDSRCGNLSSNTPRASKVPLAKLGKQSNYLCSNYCPDSYSACFFCSRMLRGDS